MNDLGRKFRERSCESAAETIVRTRAPYLPLYPTYNVSFFLPLPSTCSRLSFPVARGLSFSSVLFLLGQAPVLLLASSPGPSPFEPVTRHSERASGLENLRIVAEIPNSLPANDFHSPPRLADSHVLCAAARSPLELFALSVSFPRRLHRVSPIFAVHYPWQTTRITDRNSEEKFLDVILEEPPEIVRCARHRCDFLHGIVGVY